MAWSKSFSPQVRGDTQILILGSMPGIKSLQDVQYYAHPRNAFWAIIESLFSISSSSEYDQRLQLLNDNFVGLWDVYAKCYRAGSLDSAIDKKTAEINNFKRLLEQFPAIHTLCFNGKAAEQAFKKQVLPLLEGQKIELISLPSTSPANAAISFEAKLEQWQIVKKVVRHVG